MTRGYCFANAHTMLWVSETEHVLSGERMTALKLTEKQWYADGWLNKERRKTQTKFSAFP